jgi:hypothetical protein
MPTNKRAITHATSNLGISLNLKLVLYLEVLANPNNGLNLVPNPLSYQNVGRYFSHRKLKMNNMKKAILIFILCLTHGANVFAQDSLEINKNWKMVNQQLILRTEITLALTKELQKSKTIDKVELKNTELYAKELKLVCENKILSKNNVDLIKEKNAKLTTSLTHTLVNLEFDNKLKIKKETLLLIDQLSKIETQLFTEIKKYNKSCKKYNKEELIFITQYGNESP